MIIHEKLLDLLIKKKLCIACIIQVWNWNYVRTANFHTVTKIFETNSDKAN